MRRRVYLLIEATRKASPWGTHEESLLELGATEGHLVTGENELRTKSVGLTIDFDGWLAAGAEGAAGREQQQRGSRDLSSMAGRNV